VLWKNIGGSLYFGKAAVIINMDLRTNVIEDFYLKKYIGVLPI
jgi:hypothetical protein